MVAVEFLSDGEGFSGHESMRGSYGDPVMVAVPVLWVRQAQGRLVVSACKSLAIEGEITEV